MEKKYSRKLNDGGTVFVGEKGIMVAGNYCDESADPARGEAPGLSRAAPRRCRGVKKGLTHYTDFLRACKEGGKPPCSHFDYAGPLTEMVLLGCLAIRAGVGQKVDWDSAQ